MKKALIVDDVPLNVLLVSKMLHGLPLEIVTANNGQQAMDKIRQEMPDILLLDLLMPIVDGYTVLQKVREGECGPADLPIIVLSALSGPSVDKAMKLGADNFLTKPINMQLLIKNVKDTLSLN